MTVLALGLHRSRRRREGNGATNRSAHRERRIRIERLSIRAVDAVAEERDARDGARPSTDGALPLPIWDGEPPDYEAAVDALITA